MNQKSVFSISLFLVIILVSTSFSPQATHAQEPEQNQDFIATFTNYPGITLKAGDEALTWSNYGDGCLASYYDGNMYKSFVAPLTLPKGSRITGIVIDYKNEAESTGDYWIELWRSYVSGGQTQLIAREQFRRKSSPGYTYIIFDLDHNTDTSLWNYWVEVVLPKGPAKTAICNVKVISQIPAPPVYRLGLPLVVK